MPPVRKLNISKIQVPPKISQKTPQELFNISESFNMNINNKEYRISWPDFDRDMTIIGQGAFGIIYKAIHSETQFEMAIKKLRLTDDFDDCKQIMREKEVGLIDCTYTVNYFGVLFADESILMCMELMATCTEQLYQHAKNRNLCIDECIIQTITVSTLLALKYLREKMIAHRDVKPSNILVDVDGNVKLCDFGVSGSLVNSVTTSFGVGCSSYMAPEKLDENAEINGVTVKAEIWSLGISLVEIATMEPIYLKKYTQFQCACKILKDPPPLLPFGYNYSNHLYDFIKDCLIKNPKLRPNFCDLLDTPFILSNFGSGKETLAKLVQNISDLLPALRH